MKSKKPDIKEMVKYINLYGPFRIEYINGKYVERYQILGVTKYDYYSKRQIHKLYNSINTNKGDRKGLDCIKHFDHRGNRNRTKHLINNHKFDEIPQNKKCYSENHWNWN